MRRITSILVSALLALVAVGAFVTPAGAAGGACGNWFDSPGTVYANGDYRAAAGNQFFDNYAGTFTHLNVDIQSWRYTATGTDGFTAGHCYRQIRYSMWVDDGDYGSIQMHVRQWANFGTTCSSLVTDEWEPLVWAGGQQRYGGWFDYSGCGGPQGDVSAHGSNPDWTPYYPGEVPSPYVNV